MSKLVLIGGPPGVGKTTALSGVERAFERCACLDADDAWRVHPFEVNDATRALAERNVIGVLRGYLEAGYPLVLLTWVLANPLLIERILHGLDGLFQSALISHLVASPEVLEERLKRKSRTGSVPLLKYALFKLEQIGQLPYPRIDTTHLGTEAVVDRIVDRVNEANA